MMIRDRACLSLGDGALGQGACFWGGRGTGPQPNTGEVKNPQCLLASQSSSLVSARFSERPFLRNNKTE